MVTTIESYNLLVIEDDLSEQKLINMMVKNSGYTCIIKFINNGEDAIDFINSYNPGNEVLNKIHLILLDLNLPRAGGIEVLQTLKNNSLLQNTPAVILTTSNNKSDVEQAYQAGAAGFIRKPSTSDEYEIIIKQIFKYWFEICLIA